MMQDIQEMLDREDELQCYVYLYQRELHKVQKELQRKEIGLKEYEEKRKWLEPLIKSYKLELRQQTNSINYLIKVLSKESSDYEELEYRIEK